MSANEKRTGKSEQITIKAEKGRLSDEDIERMVRIRPPSSFGNVRSTFLIWQVREEEENREADKAFADKIEARNALESYVYSLRTSMQALPILISPDSLN